MLSKIHELLMVSAAMEAMTVAPKIKRRRSSGKKPTMKPRKYLKRKARMKMQKLSRRINRKK